MLIFCVGSYWNDANNRRRFFEKFAEKEGFDPLLASNWYLTEYSSFQALRVAVNIGNSTRY